VLNQDKDKIFKFDQDTVKYRNLIGKLNPDTFRAPKYDQDTIKPRSRIKMHVKPIN
jgi:hypothetical protein